MGLQESRFTRNLETLYSQQSTILAPEQQHPILSSPTLQIKGIGININIIYYLRIQSLIIWILDDGKFDSISQAYLESPL